MTVAHSPSHRHETPGLLAAGRVEGPPVSTISCDLDCRTFKNAPQKTGKMRSFARLVAPSPCDHRENSARLSAVAWEWKSQEPSR